MTICSTLVNWCTLQMPLSDRPCAPTSLLKQGETPTILIGSSDGSMTSPILMAVSGCSLVAIR